MVGARTPKAQSMPPERVTRTLRSAGLPGLRRCGELPDFRREFAGDKIRNGHAFEHLSQPEPERDPDSRQRPSSAPVFEFLRAQAAYAGQWALERTDHVGDGDLVGGSGESKSALLSAHAAHDAAAFELEEDVLKEGDRDLLGTRHLVARHRA